MLLRLRQATISIIALAWMLFLLSFLLPARNTETGWETFTASITVIFAHPYLLFVEPRLAPLLTFPFVNVLMLLSPFIAFVLREKFAVLLLFLIPAMVSIWYMPDDILGELEIGFYAWLGSMFMMAFGSVIGTVSLGSWDDIDDWRRLGMGKSGAKFDVKRAF